MRKGERDDAIEIDSIDVQPGAFQDRLFRGFHFTFRIWGARSNSSHLGQRGGYVERGGGIDEESLVKSLPVRMLSVEGEKLGHGPNFSSLLLSVLGRDHFKMSFLGWGVIESQMLSFAAL